MKSEIEFVNLKMKILLNLRKNWVLKEMMSAELGFIVFDVNSFVGLHQKSMNSRN